MINHANPDRKNTPKTLSPSPLVHITYIQFLVDISKVYEKIETKFFTLEADAYIAKLVNEYNGFIFNNFIQKLFFIIFYKLCINMY